MYPNPLKRKIKAGELVLGTGLPAFTPAFATMTARTGVDFLWIDTEHSPFGAESLEAVPVLVRNQGVAPMIRVAWNDPHLIKKAMDVGASAIMVPQVNTAEEAKAVVAACRYPPQGMRGAAGGTRAAAYGFDMKYYDRAADDLIIVVQIENPQAVDNAAAARKLTLHDVARRFDFELLLFRCELRQNLVGVRV